MSVLQTKQHGWLKSLSMLTGTVDLLLPLMLVSTDVLSLFKSVLDLLTSSALPFPCSFSSLVSSSCQSEWCNPRLCQHLKSNKNCGGSIFCRTLAMCCQRSLVIVECKVTLKSHVGNMSCLTSPLFDKEFT